MSGERANFTHQQITLPNGVWRFFRSTPGMIAFLNGPLLCLWLILRTHAAGIWMLAVAAAPLVLLVVARGIDGAGARRRNKIAEWPAVVDTNLSGPPRDVFVEWGGGAIRMIAYVPVVILYLMYYLGMARSLSQVWFVAVIGAPVLIWGCWLLFGNALVRIDYGSGTLFRGSMMKRGWTQRIDSVRDAEVYYNESTRRVRIVNKSAEMSVNLNDIIHARQLMSALCSAKTAV